MTQASKQTDKEAGKMDKVIHLDSDDRLERVQSQKAKALFNLKKVYQSWPSLQTYPLFLDDHPHTVERALWKSIDNSPDHHAFIRACPLSPRHGVLESAPADGVVSGIEVFERIRDVMAELEPDGCVIVQPFVGASSSAVLAPDMYMTIGPSHDGVTAGHGFQITLPLSSIDSSDSYSFVSAIGEDKDKVELEFVFKSETETQTKQLFLTQVRACDEHIPLGNAKVSVNGGAGVAGFLPNGDHTVGEYFVIESIDDIMELEEVVQGEMPDGFTVFHPSGSLLSHASAHCRSHAVSYVVADLVEGATLTSDNSYDPADYEDQFRMGIEYSRNAWQKDWGWLSTFFHQYIAEPHCEPRICAFLGGCFVGWLIHAGMAASIGEVRHARNVMHSYAPAIGGALGAMVGDTPTPQERHEYYKALLNFAPTDEDITAALNWCKHIFAHQWSGSYGGKNWRKCSTAILDLHTAVIEGDFSDIVETANKTENMAHNTGWLFNKFLPKEALDYGTGGFRVNGHRINYAFETYEMAHGIMQNLHESGFNLDQIEKRNPVETPWKTILEDDDFDIEAAIKTAGSSWQHHKGPVSDCDGCRWCSAIHYKGERGSTTSADTVVAEELTEKEGMPHLISSILSGQTITSSPEGWLIGEEHNEVDMDVEVPTFNWGVSWTMSEEEKKGWNAGIALVKEHHVIDPTLANFIYKNVCIVSNGLKEGWNKALVKANAIMPDQIDEVKGSTGKYHSFYHDTHMASSNIFCHALQASSTASKNWNPKCYLQAYAIVQKGMELFGNAGPEPKEFVLEWKPIAKDAKWSSSGDLPTSHFEPFMGMEMPMYLINKGHFANGYEFGWNAGVALAVKTGQIDENLAAFINTEEIAEECMCPETFELMQTLILDWGHEDINHFDDTTTKDIHTEWLHQWATFVGFTPTQKEE